jgi:hypothetical protein
MGKARTASRFATFMKWVGTAAALLSFGTAVYEVLHSQAELRERKRVVGEQYSAARAQQAAGDFASAWDSLARASAAAEPDGLVAKLLGGLSPQRREVRTAQEDLAMLWVRDGRVTDDHEFSALADKLVGVLAAGAATSAGPRKADLLGHLGWAYFLKRRGGDLNVQPETAYRDAVAADATNPYANVFWGHWILWNHGSLEEARARFRAALATGRARPEVRHFQLAALANVRTDEADAAWWQVVGEMHRNGEMLDEDVRGEMYSRYYFALNDDAQLRRLQAALPPADHIELEHLLLQASPGDAARRGTLTAVLALMLEAAGRSEEALATWRALQAETRAEHGSALAARADAAIKRLAGTMKHRPARSSNLWPTPGRITPLLSCAAVPV